MPTIAEIRQQYPDYNDMSDEALASALHSKFYSDIPRAEFNQKIGMGEPAKALPVDPVMDTAKSIPTGVIEGTLGLADIPQLAVQLGQKANDKLQTAIFGPSQISPNQRIKNAFDEFGPKAMTASQAMQSILEKQTGPLYQPQTYPGQWGKTTGEWLPAILGGPEGIATKAVTRVGVPMLATEGAGYLTKGTSAEMPARMATALLAGPAASRAFSGRGAPSSEQLRKSYTDTINDPTLRATPVNTAAPTTVRTELAGPGYHIADDVQGASLADRIKVTLAGEGKDRINSKQTYGRVNELDRMNNATAGDLINLRQVLSADSKGIPDANKVAAGIAKRELDKEISAVSPEFRNANRDYMQAKKSDLVTGKQEYAGDRAAVANSGMNEGNITRQQLVQILNPKNPERRNWSPEEIAQLRRVTGGTATGNTARYFSNLLGGGGGIGQTLVAAGLGGGAGYAAGDTHGAGAGAIAAVLAGRGLKGIERASVARQTSKLDELIRSRAPLAANQPMLTAADIDRITRALVRRENAATRD